MSLIGFQQDLVVNSWSEKKHLHFQQKCLILQPREISNLNLVGKHFPKTSKGIGILSLGSIVPILYFQHVLRLVDAV
jgi:hypothetical protein